MQTSRTIENLPEEPRFRGFASRGDIFVLVLLFILSSLIGSLAIRFGGFQMPQWVDGELTYPDSWSFTAFLSYAAQMGVMLLLVLLYRHLRGTQAPLARFSLKGLNPLVIIWGIGAMLSVNVVCEPLLSWLDFDILEQPNPGRGGWTLLSVVVLAPLLEELLCRGVLLEGLRSRYGATSALIGSSLFFAVIHFHPVMVVNALILGLLFGYFYLRFESLWTPMLLHAFNNSLALLLMWAEFPGEEFDGRPMADLTLSELLEPATYWVVYGVALAIVAWTGWKIVRRVRFLNREKGKNCTEPK